MDTITINKLLKDFECFKGVFPLDLIPSIKERPFIFIINTHKSDMPGEHWVSIAVDKYGNGEYFDSFGLPPLHAEIIQFLDEKCYNRWRFNPIALQSSTSTTCGHYCVLYVMCRCQGYSYHDFIRKFTDDTRRNDFKVNLIFGEYTLGNG